MKTFSYCAEGPAAVEDVFSVLTSSDWPERLAEALGDATTLVSRTVGDDGSVELVMSRLTPVPSFLARFGTSELPLTITDRWGPSVAGRRVDEWFSSVSGAPVKVHGLQIIEPCPLGSRHTTSGEVSVSLPLLGGKVEAYILGEIERIASVEAELVRSVLHPV